MPLYTYQMAKKPWLVWLSGLSAGLGTKGCQLLVIPGMCLGCRPSLP